MLKGGPAEVLVEHDYEGAATDGRKGWLRITWNYKCIGSRPPGQVEVHEVGCKGRGKDDTPLNGCSSDAERLGQTFGAPVPPVYRLGCFHVTVGEETTACMQHNDVTKGGMKEALEALPNVQEASQKNGSIFRVGIFLDFVRPTTRTMHPHGVHAWGAKRNRLDRCSLIMLPLLLPFQASMVHYEGHKTVGKLWQVQLMKQGGQYNEQ